MLVSRTSWAVLGISIFITLLVWGVYLNLEFQLRESEFNSKTDLMTQNIIKRLEQYEQVLKGAKGLLSSKEVTPEDWKNFVSIQGLSDYPDVQGLGFTKHVKSQEELDSLTTQMNGYGFEDFSVTPKGIRSDYYPVIFMWPMDFRNERAIGYDTYFEESRKKAVDLSIATGEATLTGKLILVQETETDIQNGFLLMQPVFEVKNNLQNNNDPSSVMGMVNAVFRINDFIDGVIGEQNFEFVHMMIYDESKTPETLFFDSNSFYNYDSKKSNFTKEQNIAFGNRNWILVYEGVIPSLNPFEGFVLFLFPILGFSMSGLLFFVLYLSNKNLQLVKNSIKSKKLENIGKLAAALAHDLRNPLSVASGAMYLLSKKSENLDEKSKNLIIKSNTAIERMRHQINDVMDYVQTGDLNIHEISLKELLKLPEVTFDIGSNITLNLPQNDILLFCDKQKITVLLSNLVSNAAQAIGEKTGTITVRFFEKGKNIVIEVEDSGPGIPEENLKNIFEPLYTTKQKGTGLGLASCKHIVDSHNGKIDVTNTPTLFRITLPKHPHNG